jgi:hypothetical protein
MILVIKSCVLWKKKIRQTMRVPDSPPGLSNWIVFNSIFNSSFRKLFIWFDSKTFWFDRKCVRSDMKRAGNWQIANFLYGVVHREGRYIWILSVILFCKFLLTFYSYIPGVLLLRFVLIKPKHIKNQKRDSIWIRYDSRIFDSISLTKYDSILNSILSSETK